MVCYQIFFFANLYNFIYKIVNLLVFFIEKVYTINLLIFFISQKYIECNYFIYYIMRQNIKNLVSRSKFEPIEGPFYFKNRF